MHKIKVAYVATVPFPLRYLLLDHLKSIREEGYEVVAISSPGPEIPAIKAIGVRHIAVPMTRRFTPFADLISLLRLIRVIRREQFTIVHTHNPKPGLLGQLAAKIAGTSIIMNTVHGFYFHENMPPRRRQFYVTMEKIAARCSDLIICQSREDIQTAIKEGICPPHKIKYLGNGIDIDRFDRACVDNATLKRTRKELGLRADRPVVGFVGRLVAEKGLLELLQAARTILEQIPDTQFLIVGPVDDEKPDAITPAIAEKYGVAEACFFTGTRHDLPALYALMDVFVLPSHREGFPRSAMEASAMQVPGVMTDIRGCREVIENERNGLLVPVKDVTALAEAIIRLLNDDELKARMGRAGRQIAEADFDEQPVIAKVKAEYERFLLANGLPVPTLA